MAANSNSRLLTLTPELLLAIVNCLPNFTDLLSVILTHRTFNEIWQTNEFAICGAIARNDFGPLWDDVYALLVAQSTLKHHNTLDTRILFDKCHSQPGNGVLEGGTKIGFQELFQIIPRYRQQLRSWGDVYTRNALEFNSWLSENHRNLGTINIATLPISPDKQFRIDRALLRYWLLLNSGASEVVAHNDRQRWTLKRAGGLLNAVNALTHEDPEEASARWSRVLEPFLSLFSEHEEEIQEILQVASCSTTVLPFPGCAGIWGDQYHGNWSVVTRDMGQLTRWTILHIRHAVFVRHTRNKGARRRDVYGAFMDFCAWTGL